MEQATIALPLEGLVWLPDADIPQAVRRGATLRSTKRILKNTAISPYPSPLTPIFGTPAFQPGVTDPCFSHLLRRRSSRLLHFSVGNRLMTNREIERDFSLDLDFLCRTQLSAFLRSMPITFTAVRAPSMFEQLCLTGEPLRHPLSYLYALLIGLDGPQELAFLQAWARDLGVTFYEVQKDRILFFAHKASLASRYQEGGYKILTRWHRTPAILHRIFPRVSNVCWQCQESEGTILHIFWKCPGLKEF